MTPMLEIREVIAGYGAGDVLQGVDLGVEPGSVTCIVGPNGAGKSTVLRAVSGLLRPRQGTIEFEGRDDLRADAGGDPRLGISQVPQIDGLFPNLTVRENVLMGAYIVRGDRALVGAASPRSPSCSRWSPSAPTSRRATSPAASAGRSSSRAR